MERKLGRALTAVIIAGTFGVLALIWWLLPVRPATSSARECEAMAAVLRQQADDDGDPVVVNSILRYPLYVTGRTHMAQRRDYRVDCDWAALGLRVSTVETMPPDIRFVALSAYQQLFRPVIVGIDVHIEVDLASGGSYEVRADNGEWRVEPRGYWVT